MRPAALILRQAINVGRVPGLPTATEPSLLHCDIEEVTEGVQFLDDGRAGDTAAEPLVAVLCDDGAT